MDNWSVRYLRARWHHIITQHILYLYDGGMQIKKCGKIMKIIMETEHTFMLCIYLIKKNGVFFFSYIQLLANMHRASFIYRIHATVA